MPRTCSPIRAVLTVILTVVAAIVRRDVLVQLGTVVRDALRSRAQLIAENALCERFLGSVRRECLDHVLVLGDRHLERVLAEYIRYFNAERPHQGLGQKIPTGAGQPANANGRVIETPVLGGLHHAYRRAA